MLFALVWRSILTVRADVSTTRRLSPDRQGMESELFGFLNGGVYCTMFTKVQLIAS